MSTLASLVNRLTDDVKMDVLRATLAFPRTATLQEDRPVCTVTVVGPSQKINK